MIKKPQKMLERITSAWIAAAVVGLITSGISILILLGDPIPGYNPWMMIDVVIIFGLAYGIYRKSRICAIIMFIYFVSNQIMTIVEGAAPASLLITLIFAYLFLRGIQGTLYYHSNRTKNVEQGS